MMTLLDKLKKLEAAGSPVEIGFFMGKPNLGFKFSDGSETWWEDLSEDGIYNKHQWLLIGAIVEWLENQMETHIHMWNKDSEYGDIYFVSIGSLTRKNSNRLNAVLDAALELVDEKL